ncbi:metal ABC transporter substrate-binding protein [Labedella populi]|uniref:Metal ABC transporter substrate-binding protein n=1 Tax=Labedella populi TaxID=2498850 RepID=A0A444Q706_9MICO|nr:metal ABC transporter substrate-binding protein [Labedella populi]RWZ59672.1 metal ABC transporter substrate-binding protein [Labedella populi]
MRFSPSRTTAVALAVVASLATSGCASLAPADDRPVVVTTFTVLADMARNVAGDHLRIESITKIGAEIHGYEPTPGDVRVTAGADLVLDNGLGLEAWFERFVGELDVPHVVVSGDVDPLPIASDVYAGRPNPHAWMSPLEAQRYVTTMVDAFSELDPPNAADYRSNGEAYAAEIDDVHDELIDGLSGLPRSQRALVTCEGAFSYLARDGGLEEAYLWPVNAEQQATPGQIAGAIDFVERNDVAAVFCESTVSDSAMRQVVGATGARFGGVLYVDSLSLPDGPVPTYLDLLRYDVRTIVGGLTGSVAAE